MSQSWLADECRHQAILFLAANEASVAHACPAPLLTDGSRLLKRLVEEAAVAARGQFKTAEIVARVDAIFREQASEHDAGIPATPWTRAELVGWWVDAGKGLEALDPGKRDVLARAARTGGDAMHPALWCAERLGRFSVSGFRILAAKDDWSEPAASLGECLRRLFLWVVSPERPRAGLSSNSEVTVWYDKLRTEARDIVADAAALFGKGFRLRSGGALQLATSEKWVARWSDARVGGAVINEIREPVIYPSQEGTKVLAKGVALVQPPQTLIAELAQLPELSRAAAEERSGNVPALARATDFAWHRWRSGVNVSKDWGIPGGRGFGTLPVEAVEPALLAVGRWLTAAWVVAELDGAGALRGAPGDLVEGMRISLALDGYRLREARGGTPSARAIPHTARVGGGRRFLVLCRQSPVFEAPLGCLDEPASCAAKLFAAIEAVDWRLWAFNAAPLGPGDDIARQIVELLRRQVLRSDDWEAIKRQSLHASGGPGDEHCLARLYTFAHQRRLALELFRSEVYGEKPAHSMLEGLIQEFRQLAQESLRALAAVGPAALGRLEPPRQEDGAIDVPAWLGRGGPGGRPADEAALPHQIRWVRDQQPSGTLLDERRVGAIVEVVLSAEDAPDLELAVLNAPSLAAGWAGMGDEDSAGGLAERLAGLKAEIAFPRGGGAQPSALDPIAALRAAFAGEAAPAFHELIARCRAGDEAACAWVRLLNGGARFGFACHPPFDLESGSVQPPSLDDAFLAWEFDATVPVGKDLTVRFAIAPAGARRVISLGPRREGAVADRAESLAAACLQAGGPLARLGEDARVASHRWSTLGAEARHPVFAAEPLLEELLRSEVASPASRTAVFQAAAAWCESLDHGLLPTEWRAEGRLQPAAFGDVVLPTEFDDLVPTGMVAVRRFGVRGRHGWPFSGAVSAGPAPAGYREFRTAVDLLGNSQDVGHNPPHADLVRRADELAKHALAGTLPLALPNLFDRLWETIGSVSDLERRTTVEAATFPLFEMLKVACRMIPFDPSKVGEYPAGWIREADGVQPRGRRIKRIVRPGLRTVENVLVRPALVITE